MRRRRAVPPTCVLQAIGINKVLTHLGAVVNNLNAGSAPLKKSRALPNSGARPCEATKTARASGTRP